MVDQVHPLPMRVVLNHLLVPILMAIVMSLAYFGGFHGPDPHGMKVAIVGPSAQAGPLAAGLEERLGDMLDITTVPDEDAAQEKLLSRDIVAAYVPSESKPTLLTASAASESAANVVVRIFTEVARQSDRPLTINDLVPPEASDPIGQNAFFYLIVLSIGGYATGIAIAAAGASRRFRDRLALVIGVGVLMPVLTIGVGVTIFGMFASHSMEILAVSIAYCTTVTACTVGLHPLIGRFSTLVFNALFVAVNFTSSGGVFPPSMQPGFFGWLHEFWIGAAFVDLTQYLVYFPQADPKHAVWIFLGWALAALLSLAVAYSVELKRRRAEAARTRTAQLEDMLQAVKQGQLTPAQATQLELEEDFMV